MLMDGQMDDQDKPSTYKQRTELSNSVRYNGKDIYKWAM